jgi:hypothetical protein
MSRARIKRPPATRVYQLVLLRVNKVDVGSSTQLQKLQLILFTASFLDCFHAIPFSIQRHISDVPLSDSWHTICPFTWRQARNVPEGGIQMKTELPLLPAVIVAVTIEVTEASRHCLNRLPH